MTEILNERSGMKMVTEQVLFDWGDGGGFGAVKMQTVTCASGSIYRWVSGCERADAQYLEWIQKVERPEHE